MGKLTIQKSSPAHIICGGTNEVGELKISRHTNTDDGACLGCIYPKPIPESDEPIPTISFVSVLAGVLLAGEIIKLSIKENTYNLNNVLELNLLSSSHFRNIYIPKTDNCLLQNRH
jgi:molybdopterin/thiamine biosynthesis adenylyltransferase